MTPHLADRRLARYHVEQRQFDEAKPLFARLIDADAADPDAYGRYSELLLAAGDVQAGEDVLRKGVQQFPENIYMRFRLGNYLGAIGDYGAAVNQLQKAAELSPQAPAILRNLSVAQARTGDTAAAATAGRLQALYPSRIDFTLFHATSLEADNQPLEAEKQYRAALSAEPDNPLALELAGDATWAADAQARIDKDF